MTENGPQKDLDFLAGGGEMGALIRAHDWESTPLGPPAGWPQGLKTAVRTLLSTGHPMFIWWGPELIQFYNDAYSRSIGPERHPAALGQRGRECWEEIWDVIGPQIELVMAGEGHTWHENQLVPITRHGRREDVYWTYSYGPIDEPGAPNGVGGVLVVCTETTEQVLAEQRMRAAEARWRELFEQTPGFVCILRGPEHTFEFANARYRELVGGRDVIGRTVREALPEVEEQGFLALLDQVYRSGEPHRGSATPMSIAGRSGADAQQVYLDFVYQPIRDADGDVVGIFVDGYDVTERVLAHRKLRREDRRKDEFLAMLAHELRNPLAPILNASERLTRTVELAPELRKVGELLVRQVSQITRLVDDLLDLSRITQDRIELQREPLELGDAVERAVESVEPLAAEKEHEIVRPKAEEPVWVDGDRTRIVQCIANLLTNAIKYTPVGGRIEVLLGREGESAVVTVTDTGVGISREMLSQVFELFVQGDRTLERSQGGLGVGLSVVQRLVQMHGGEVRVASEGRGHGSTFEIRLPASEPPPARDVRPDEVEPRPQRILVVDDHPDAADSLVELLRFRGHRAEAVYSAHQVVERVRELAADTVLLDIGLPEMDGYEVARQLRAGGAGGVLIALTGYGRAEDVRRAEEAGFDAHLTKPVGLDDLERTLRETHRKGEPEGCRGGE